MDREAKLLGYARVSKDDQNLSLQLDALQRAGCKRIFIDDGISGYRKHRPGIDDTLKELTGGDTLLAWSVDRLGRNVGNLIDLKDECGRRQVELRSIMEVIDLTTADGEFAFHLAAALAQREYRKISERTKAGMASAKARGAVFGRPRKLTAAQIRRARRDLAANKRNVKALARRFGVAPITLVRALKRSEASSASPRRAADR
jgi:DNA invertase Pin-like site-specific DNA recombinase